MLRKWLNTRKPRAARSTQVLLAELMWTVVGTGLSALGLYWILMRYGSPGLAYATPFLVLGAAKALLIMDRVARRAVTRIQERGGDYCAGGFFSVWSWGAIILMIVLGQVLRISPVPPADVGFVYVAVGSGLLISSRILWRVWWGMRGSGLPAE